MSITQTSGVRSEAQAQPRVEEQRFQEMRRQIASLAPPAATQSSEVTEVAPASPIKAPGIVQGSYTHNNLYVGVNMTAGGFLDFAAGLAKNNPKLAKAAGAMQEFLKANPNAGKIFAVEVDLSPGHAGDPLLNGNAVIHLKFKPQHLADLAPGQRDKFIDTVRGFSPDAAQAIRNLTTNSGHTGRPSNFDVLPDGLLARSDVRMTGTLDKLLTGRDPEWRVGVLHWVGPAEIPVPAPLRKAMGTDNLEVIAFASLRNRDLGADRGSLQVITGIEVGGPKAGPVEFMVGAFNNTVSNNAMGARSQTSDVVKRVDNGKVSFGVEVQVPDKDGKTETRFLALPQIRDAVLEATRGNAGEIRSTEAKEISLRDFGIAKVNNISPEAAEKAARAAATLEAWAPAADAFDKAATILAPIAAAKFGPLPAAWAAFQSIGKIRDEQIGFLHDNKITDPKNAADFIWQPVKRGPDALADLSTLMPDAIDRGLSTGTIDFQGNLRAWKDIADNGFHGEGSKEVYHSPRIDGPRPFTKGEAVQAFAQKMVYGEVEESLRGIMPGVAGLGNPQTIDGYAYYAHALNRSRDMVQEAVNESGGKLSAPGIDFERGDMKVAVRDSLAFLQEHAPEKHARLVGMLANSEPADRTETFGWAPLDRANEQMRRNSGFLGIGAMLNRPEGSLDHWNIERYTRISGGSDVRLGPTDYMDPSVAANDLLQTARVGMDGVRGMSQRIRDGIEEGLKGQGVEKLVENFQVWHEIALDGYNGPRAREVFDTPDGKRFRKSDLVQAFAQNLVFGEVDEKLRHLAPTPDKSLTVPGFAFYGNAVKLALDKAEVFQETSEGIAVLAPKVDVFGDPRVAVGKALAFLGGMNPEAHDELVRSLANSGSPRIAETFGSKAVEEANAKLRDSAFFGVQMPWNRPSNSIDVWSIEQYQKPQELDTAVPGLTPGSPLLDTIPQFPTAR